MHSTAPTITLTGLKHAGKSSTGRRIAGPLGRRFIDGDDIVVDLHNGSLPTNSPGCTTAREVYQSVGSDRFQELERDAVAVAIALADDTRGTILATGGGICDNRLAFEMITEQTYTVFLDESPDILYDRVIARGLPAFLDPERPAEHFREIAARRRALYRQRADRVVDTTGLTVDEISDVIIQILR